MSAKQSSGSYFLYPVSALLALQYGILVILPALWKGRPFSLVYAAPLTAIAISLLVEGWMSHFRFGGAPRTLPSTTAGFVIGLVGVSASLVKSLLGAGIYATQVGETSASPAASFATPFVWWTGIGAGLIVFNWFWGGCTRSRALTLLAILLVLQQIVGLFVTGFGGAFLIVGVPIVFGSLVTRMVGTRHLAVAAVLLLFLWPSLLQVRNDVRISSDARAARPVQDPFSRLELDELLLLAERVEIPPSVLLSPLETLRYGLIPRALDPGRPDLQTGQAISIAVGGSPTNSMTFTLVGNLYAESGWLLLIGYVACVTLVVAALIRWNQPWVFAFVMTTALPLLGVESLFPNSIIGAIQAAVSAATACLALYVWHIFFRTRSS